MDLALMRSRISDERTSATWNYSGVDNNVPFSSSTTIGVTAGTHSQAWDVRSKNFRARMKRGEIIVNDFRLERVVRNHSQTSFVLGPYPNYHQGYVIRYEGSVAEHLELVAPVPESHLSGSIPSGMGAKAITSCLAKINSSELCSGEILKDLDATVQMLRRPFGTSRDLLKKIRWRRDKYLKKSASNFVSATRNAWLEARYGLIPTLCDIEAITDKCMFNRNAYVTRRRLVARSGVSEECDKTSSYDQVGLPWTTTWRFGGTVQRKHSVAVSAGIIYDVENYTSTEEIGRFLGTRPSDMLPTLWERMPYSFVVDWFLNVGQWLTAISPNPYANVKGSWITTINNDQVVYHPGTIDIDVWVPTKKTETRSHAGYSNMNTIITREANPPLTATLAFDAKLSTLQSIDGLALFANKLAKETKALFRR